jgi:[glutamine synthetase] adenylyltransferase / [glutamine synthetase]-adenylyl-L-tyrosine phosphorylase
VVREAWSRWSARVNLKEEIGKMYWRILKQRVKGDDRIFFKTGKGGLIGIEFLVQYLQMEHQIPENNTLRAIDKLGLLFNGEDRATLVATYKFLRRVESVLRRVSNSPVSQLPSNPEELRLLSVRMGFNSQEEFLHAYTAFRTKAEAAIEAHFDGKPEI